MRELTRRDFLRYTGGASMTVAALTIPGCGPLVQSAIATPPPPPPTGSSTAGVAPPTDADWQRLAGQIGGRLTRPQDQGYAASTQLFNPYFDGAQPAAVVYCATPSDVQRVIAFVRAHGLPLTARSGGHSYGGYSVGPGVVCDVGSMNQVSVSGGGGASAGAGARLIDVHAALAPAGLAFPSGTCPSVGLAGLAMGGGVGVIGRKFGLSSDNVTALQLVTPAGDLVTCDGSNNADLYWACRGGGGGNFGIVTSLSLATHPVSGLALFAMRWPWAAAADVVAGWQSWITTIPDELWANVHLLNTIGPGPPSVTVGGAFVGDSAALQPWLTALSNAVGTPPSGVSSGNHTFFDAMMAEAGCAGQSVESCHLPPVGTVQREAAVGRSDIVVQPLSGAAVSTLLAGVEQRNSNPAATTIAGVAFDSFGGAINRVDPAATAFVHRRALFGIQYNATWPTAAHAAVRRSNIQGVDDLYAAMRQYWSGFAYQNYIDPRLANWQKAYYGDNLSRLISVQSRYDPDGILHFAQSIPRQ